MKKKGLLVFLTFSYFFLHAQQESEWNQVSSILARIKAPQFPSLIFDITDYGAKTDGSISTTSIQTAINACNQAGGGTVIVPRGVFLTGALYLKSNVRLHIDYGATLKFSTNTSDYLPVVLTRFEGVECYNYSPFIYALGEENIAITGSGTLDGQASYANWWAWKSSGAADVSTLNTMGQNGIPVEQRLFGNGHKIRPNFIQPYRCKNVLIDSVTIINSPMWEVHPVLSENVTVSHLTINSHGPNNDGCNPECSKDVWIYRCQFDTGDDCIAIKSGRNNDGRRINVPSENIVIQQCTMKDGHGGITMGSECSGGIRNVFAEDCQLNSPNLDCALRIKTNSVRGGVIENIFMRRCTITQVAGEAFQIDMNYQEGDAGSFTPIVRHIVIDSITAENCPTIFNFNGYQRAPVSDVKLSNSQFNKVTGNTLVNVQKLQIYNTLSNGTVPLTPAPVTDYQHAEAYVSKSDWGWSNVQSGFTGNAYMEPVSNANTINWEVNSTSPTWDTLVWQYSSTSVSTCSLIVNDGFQKEFDFSDTKSAWKPFKTPFPAQNGKNTIRLVAKDTSMSIYLDRLRITKGKALVVNNIQNTELLPHFSLTSSPSLISTHANLQVGLPFGQEIQLIIYPLEGKQQEILYSGTCQAGLNNFLFERAGRASGIYIVHIQTAQARLSTKVVLCD